MTIKILSIDGGGIRGILPAMLLDDIEKRTNQPISSLFDFIAGTSTGGIISLALSLTDEEGNPIYSAKDIGDLYLNHGKEIFSRSFAKKLFSLFGLFGEKYSHRPLEGLLDSYFGEHLLNESSIPLLISAYDIENREPFFFKSWKDGTASLAMKTVARATSAAPTYFEPAELSIMNKTHYLIDGGVCANNPAMCAYAEALRLYGSEEEFLLVSLGTGEQTRPIRFEQAKRWGKIQWISSILSILFDGATDTVDYQLNLLLQENFYRLQTVLDIANDDMDDSSSQNLSDIEREGEKLKAHYDKVIQELCQTLSRE